MLSLKEKLAALDRPRMDITIKSRDGQRELSATYQRPTEAEDTVLRKMLNEEYDKALKTLKEAKDGDESVYAVLLKSFTEAGVQAAANYMLLQEFPQIREEAIRQIGLEEPKEDASEEVKKRFQEPFEEAFNTERDKRRDRYMKEYSPEVLTQKATDLNCGNLAFGRANEVYRRALVAHSLYEKVEDGSFVRVFESGDEVAEHCAADTITTISRRVMEELQKARQLPLN